MLKVAHHGAANGVTVELLEATTPCLATMGVGPHNGGGGHTARGYGHPNRWAMEALRDGVSGSRPRRDIMVFDRANVDPRRMQASSAIFGTAWDGHHVIYATGSGRCSVVSEREGEVDVTCP